MPPALAVSGLEKRYGPVTALAGVDLEVAEGELVGLLGPNGAGKSTLVKISCGLVRASGGTAQVLDARAGSIEARRRIGYLAELFRFPGWYTADELLELHQRLAGSREAPPSGSSCSSSSSSPRRVTAESNKCRRACSSGSGSRRRLSASLRCCSCDEPTSALDPVGRRTVRMLLEELRGRGTSVLLNSHLLSEIELVCDRVAILRHGRLVAEGSPAELARARGVEIETDEGVRLFEGASRDDAPRLVAELVAAGRRVYGVSVLTSTLEDTYLEAVGGETS